MPGLPQLYIPLRLRLRLLDSHWGNQSQDSISFRIFGRADDDEDADLHQNMPYPFSL